MQETPIQETESAIPANVMGASSSVPGTGAIDMFDPLMTKPIKRQPLRNIIGKTALLRDLKKDKK